MAYIERMKANDYIDKTREYLDYLEKHINNVYRAFNVITLKCKGMPWVSDDYTWHTLRREVELHDLSKFSSEEFVQYRKNFFPIDDVEKQNSGFAAAWENHKLKNSHHHQTARTVVDLMNMIIDWTAMSYEFGGSAQEYYENNKDKINLCEMDVEFIYSIFEKLRDE